MALEQMGFVKMDAEGILWLIQRWLPLSGKIGSLI